MKRLCFLCVLGIWIGACSQGQQTQQQEDTPQDSTAAENTDAGQIESGTFQGWYVNDSVNNSFKYCEDGQYYQVSGSAKAVQRLAQSYQEKVRISGEPIYIEFKGDLYRTTQQNEGSVVIKEILTEDYRNLENQCFDLEFMARGNEPFWHIEVISGDEIIFTDLASSSYLRYAYQAPTQEEDTYLYTLTRGQNTSDSLRITIQAEKCQDNMSGELFDYRAEIQWNGNTYQGCASKPDSTSKNPNN